MKPTLRNRLLMLEPQDWYRFWSKVEKTGGCWFWTAASDGDGYGTFIIRKKVLLAHRIAFVSIGGVIPEGTELDHRCRVRGCVRPDHLEPVTHKENSARGNSGLYNSSKTYCRRGHLLAGDNLFFARTDPGHRRCRECSRARAREYKVRNVEKIRAQQREHKRELSRQRKGLG